MRLRQARLCSGGPVPVCLPPGSLACSSRWVVPHIHLQCRLPTSEKPCHPDTCSLSGSEPWHRQGLFLKEPFLSSQMPLLARSEVSGLQLPVPTAFLQGSLSSPSLGLLGAGHMGLRGRVECLQSAKPELPRVSRELHDGVGGDRGGNRRSLRRAQG